MNAEGFIDWALDDARTVEERYTTELLVELGVTWWNTRNRTGRYQSLEERMERKRQRALNPAYDPRYSEAEVHQAAETWPTVKTWWSPYGGLDERPIRDITALRFFTHLEEIHLMSSEVTDIRVLAQLPRLRVLKFSSGRCEDLTPLAECVHLRELELGIGMSWRQIVTRWPDVRGLEKLTELEKLSLTGNLHVFAPGIIWPKVRKATLKCEPLPARCVSNLPQLPACEFLTLGGVEQLDGIAACPHLRNLKLETSVRDFAPLTVLDKLTCFTCTGFEPLDVTPLTRLPKLLVATFNANFEYAVNSPKPRDFMAFTDAPVLRELHVPGCPPVESEVQTLNSLLPSWNDVWLAETPRTLPPLRIVIAPVQKFPYPPDTALDAEDNGLPDEGLRESEGRWAQKFLEKQITTKLGEADWGTVTSNGMKRQFIVTVESFAVVEKLPTIVEAIRESFARMRHEYTAVLMICLKSPQIKPTPAQVELENQFQEERDKAEYERRQQEQKEYLERLHRYELKKQLGEAIKPEDFVPPPPAPLPLPPWEREDEDDGNEFSDGDVLVKEKPDPPPSWSDDEHPLANQYRIYSLITFSEMWFVTHSRDLVIYLMARQPDLEIPEEKKTK